MPEQVFPQDVDFKVFILSHRTTDPSLYWKNILGVVDSCQDYGLDGVLLFEGNDTFVSPWVAAQETLARSSSVSPLVAVNPIYMHPFKAAKFVSSLTQIYGRQIYLNMITGTAVNYLESMSDSLTHDQRYLRVKEYIQVMQGLLKSPEPFSYEGEYYSLSNIQLLPGISSELMPVFLLSGQSDAAVKVALETGSVGTQMLPPGLCDEVGDAEAINFGVLTRPSEKEAWDAALQIFPESEEDQLIQELSMGNTDSSWKRRMDVLAKLPENKESGYWMGPFRNFRSDGPYLVGSYSYVAGVLSGLLRKGVKKFIFDVNLEGDEFFHISNVLSIVRGELNGNVDGV